MSHTGPPSNHFFFYREKKNNVNYQVHNYFHKLQFIVNCDYKIYQL